MSARNPPVAFKTSQSCERDPSGMWARGIIPSLWNRRMAVISCACGSAACAVFIG